MNTITMSAIIVTVFLGGPNGPSFGPDWVRSWIFPTLWFMVKLLVFLFAFVWFRATLPRFRYDQLMDLGWKILIPLALGWFVLHGAVDVFEDVGGCGVSKLELLPNGLLDQLLDLGCRHSFD